MESEKQFLEGARAIINLFCSFKNVFIMTISVPKAICNIKDKPNLSHPDNLSRDLTHSWIMETKPFICVKSCIHRPVRV